MTTQIDFNTLQIDQFATSRRLIQLDDIQAFANVTGDTNPVHLDADYAATTSFGRPIAHGMLTAGFISATIGTQLPGPGCIYLEQHLKFRAPVYVNDEVETRITIIDINTRRRRLTLKTECLVENKIVVSGEAVIMVP